MELREKNMGCPRNTCKGNSQEVVQSFAPCVKHAVLEASRVDALNVY